MRLALVNPPYGRLVEPLAYPATNLGYLLAYLNEHCPWVDCSVLNLAGHKPEEVVSELDGYDVVGWTAMSPHYADVVEFAKEAKKARRYQKQIIGGVHVTLTGDADSVFDAVFIGEGEEALAEYMRDIRERRYGRRLYHGTALPLDSLPYPKCETAKGRLNFEGDTKSGVVFGSRGCPYKCSYCATRAVNGRVRFRSVDSIVKEVVWLKEHGIRDIRFMDDCFLARRKQALELCKKLEPLGVTWGCLVRVTHASKELFVAMKAAGCTDVSVGVESFDQNVLDVLKKGTTVEQSRRCLKLLADVGMEARMFLMISTPGETYRRTVDLNAAGIREFPCYRLILATFMPYPGSEVCDNPEAFGIRVVEPDCSKYHFHLWQRIQGEKRLAPAWSPIRIDGMTEEQQMENMERMREVVLSTHSADYTVLMDGEDK